MSPTDEADLDSNEDDDDSADEMEDSPEEDEADNVEVEEGEEEGEEDQAESPRSTRPFLSRRPSGSTGPSRRNLEDDQPRARTNAEKRTVMIRLDHRERRFVLFASIFSFLFSLALTIPFMVKRITVISGIAPNHKRPYCPPHFEHVISQGPATCNTIYPASHYLPNLAVYLAFSVAVLATYFIGRRVPAAFVLVITGLQFSQFIALVPLAALAVWLFIRAYRVQKYGSPTARGPVTDDRGREVLGARALRTAPDDSGGTKTGTRSGGIGTTTSARGGSAGTKSSRANAAARPPRTSRKAPPPTGPAPSKRYTPKVQPRRPPQPQSKSRSKAKPTD